MTEQKINSLVLLGQLILANKIRQNITCFIKDYNAVIFEYVHDNNKKYTCEYSVSEVLNSFVAIIRGKEDSDKEAATIIAKIANEIVKQIEKDNSIQRNEK